MCSRPRVFLAVELLNYSPRNLTDFGDLVNLYKSTDNPNIWCEAIENVISSKFKALNFDPALDFFACSGIVVLSHLALTTLVEDYGTVKVLLYDVKQNKYRCKMIGAS